MHVCSRREKAAIYCVFRKFTYSRLRRVDPDIAKIIVGKAVSSSDMTYEEIESRCLAVFKLAYKDITLNGDLLGKVKQQQAEQIRRLEQAVVAISRELATQKTISETLTRKITGVARLLAYGLEKHTFPSKEAEHKALEALVGKPYVEPTKEEVERIVSEFRKDYVEPKKKMKESESDNS